MLAVSSLSSLFLLVDYVGVTLVAWYGALSFDSQCLEIIRGRAPDAGRDQEEKAKRGPAGCCHGNRQSEGKDKVFPFIFPVHFSVRRYVRNATRTAYHYMSSMLSLWNPRWLSVWPRRFVASLLRCLVAPANR